MKKLLLTLFVISSPLMAITYDRFDLGFNYARNESMRRLARDIRLTELNIKEMEGKLDDQKDQSLRIDRINFQKGKLEYYNSCKDLLKVPVLDLVE